MLLNVVGKLVARIVQSRLQVVAEKVLPESQCGFRRGRGCTDMIFVILCICGFEEGIRFGPAEGNVDSVEENGDT